MIYIEYNKANVACIEFDEPAVGCIECNTLISDPIILMLSALTLMVSKLHTSNLNNLILYLKNRVSLTDLCIRYWIYYSFTGIGIIPKNLPLENISYKIFKS